MRRWPVATLPRSLQKIPVTRYKSRKYSVLAQKIEQPVSEPPPPLPPRPTAILTWPDPYVILDCELSRLRGCLLGLLGSAHPSLNDIAKYYFLHPSQQLRPLLVLLFSRATNGLGRGWPSSAWAAECEDAARREELDGPLTRPDVLFAWNPNMPDHSASFESVFPLRTPIRHPEPPLLPESFATSYHTPLLTSQPTILPTQRRLAQIIEMIHVASQLHDDVLDNRSRNKSSPPLSSGSGNKLAVLGGDFLLGRASSALARLGDSEVVELVASVISNLVEGEILQVKDIRTLNSELIPAPRTAEEGWDLYLKKTYLKTASLMAKGARASVVLGGCMEGEVYKEVAYSYGRSLGTAFQLVEDALEYEANESRLGKTTQTGLATAPLLYAWEECPDVAQLMQRGFSGAGDVDLAREYVRQSSGIERTLELAGAHADTAREVLQLLPDSDAKEALEVLTERVITRTWYY